MQETTRTVNVAFSRRRLLRLAGAGAATLAAARTTLGQETVGGNNIEFEKTLFAMRDRNYRHRKVDIVKTGFRPVGGNVADFGVADFKGRLHFFYIERRLQEGTPFYPGHEIFFGHASTSDFVNWEVHDPVMLIRPGTWEEAHVWAPCVIRRGDEFVMAYTGLNRHISQNIGLASSKDLFEWRRWDSNPISPCKGKEWAFWREDMISSCRDPSICEHDGRYWMIFTANTRQGESCIAMVSTTDFKRWQDHGPICVGPATGYEPRLEGGHPQGSLESSNLFFRKGRWFLTVKAKIRNEKAVNWIIENDTNLKFDFAKRREFWPGATGIEIARTRGDRDLLATFTAGHIKFGLTDWSHEIPTGRFIESEDELTEWKME
ncbi:MAG TPA: hypothetical protein P5316_10130 [Phycisphaerae bacterium]|nr:hypothetical protein [Phycisphaerae bacterium]